MFEILKEFPVLYPNAPLFSVPQIKNIHQKVYAAASQPGALDMRDWHSECGTAHCRAGWVVKLAGDEGEALERITFMTGYTAMLIYAASGYEIDEDRFHDSKAAALADMKRLAEEEAKSAGEAT
jgi:hypothetical protein